MQQSPGLFELSRYYLPDYLVEDPRDYEGQLMHTPPPLPKSEPGPPVREVPKFRPGLSDDDIQRMYDEWDWNLGYQG